MYAALVVVIVIPVFYPRLHELIAPHEAPEAKSFYHAVEGLAAESAVLLVIDYDASRDGELTPQARAILWHLLNKGQGVVMVSHTPQGAAIVQDLLQSEAFRTQRVIAGEQYINLGYLPPHPASLLAFMANPLGGSALWGMEQSQVAQTALGQRITRFEDLDLIVLLSGHQEHVRWWIEQTGAAGQMGGRQVDVVASVSAGIAPYIRPYYTATSNRQVKGMLVGLAGAAQYEQLLGAQFWPNAGENLVLQGCAQILLAAIVIASGLSYVIARLRERG
jgi:hypothetical protein